MNIAFTKEEKIKYFDKIASHFYNANFGQLAKSDMELMMFEFYINKVISVNKYTDGTIDYSKCSDYRMSKDLGITQQKVRNLKVKNQLRNPMQFDWKLALAGLMKNARYDEAAHKITLNIPDPNLYFEIQNFFEEHGAYVEIQLNRKILQMRVEYFLELCIMLEPEEKRKNIIKKMKNEFKQSQSDNCVFDEKHIGRTLLNYSMNIITIIAGIESIISPENKIGVAFLEFIQSKLKP